MKTINTRIIASAAVGALLSLAAVAPAFAQAGDDLPTGIVNTAAALNAGAAAGVSVSGIPAVSASAGANASVSAKASARAAAMETRLANAEAKGGAAIAARIASLNALITRIQSMKNLSSTQIAAFQATIQGAITDMTSLQAEIQAGGSTTTITADLKSIAPDYRIYLLVEPQVSLLSASDRVNTIVATLTTLSTKIQTRLSATTNLPNIATLQSDLTDMAAKLADATTQSSAVTAEISGLVPDNGVASVQASNTAALKDARAKIKTATADLQAAYKDAQAVVAGIKGKGVSASTTTSASVSASTTTQ